jgi:hypothetical protein
MNNIENSIQNLKTLQQSFSDLANYVRQITEEVTINLNASGVSWENKYILVSDESIGMQYSYEIDDNGISNFSIPSGHSYKISLPNLSQYAPPQFFYFTATLPSRDISYTYKTQTDNELIRIIIRNGITGAQENCLNGVTLYIYASDLTEYSGVISGSSVDITIPYGKNCTLTPPTVEGYRSNSSEETFETGTPYRTFTLKYTEDNYGMFGVDDTGRLYTIDEMNALSDKTIIKYGFYNDSELATSTRVSDGIGNGFYWKVGAETLPSGKQWCIQNVEFDTIRLPFYSNLGAWKYAGFYMTKQILDIGLELFPSEEHPTPAAENCYLLQETFGGKTHNGFLLSYDQIHKIATDNRTLFQSFYAALGRTAPAIWSGYWWTSCQNSATSAVFLINGGYYFYYKTFSYSVFVAYDL